MDDRAGLGLVALLGVEVDRRVAWMGVPIPRLLLARLGYVGGVFMPTGQERKLPVATSDLGW